MTPPDTGAPPVDPVRETALRFAVQFCHRSTDPHVVVATSTAFLAFLTNSVGERAAVSA